MNLFNIKEIQKLETNPRYVIGTDVCDIPTYCLCKILRNTIEFILVKSIHDKKDFDQEVENLAKYFNAEICKTNIK